MNLKRHHTRALRLCLISALALAFGTRGAGAFGLRPEFYDIAGDRMIHWWRTDFVGPILDAGGQNGWDGGGGNGLWSNSTNWGTNVQPAYGTLNFDNTNNGQTTMTDDNITSMNGLLWTGTNNWTLNQGGSTVLSLFDFGGTQAKIENQSTGLVTINLPIIFAANNGSPPNPFGEINAVNGDITFGTGTLTVNGSSVNGIKFFGSGHTVTFNNTVNATGKWFGFTTGGSGNSVVIGSTGALTTGDFYVMNSGTLKITTGGTLTTSGLRLGGDFGNTGNQDQTKGGTLQFTTLTGGLTFGSTINTVTGNTSAALLIDSLNTSGTNTISGGIFLDSNLRINQASGGTLSLTGSTINLKAQTLSLTGSGGIINVTSAISNSVAGGQLVIGSNGTAGSGGTVTLSNTNTYSGETFIRNGTLAFTSTGSSSNSTIRFGSSSGSNIDANLNLVGTSGGVTLSNTINPVVTTGSGLLTINSQNTSGTNTLSGHFGLDRDLTINQSSGGTLAITQARAASGDTTTGFDIKNKTVTITGAGDVRIGPASPGSTSFGTIYNSTAGGVIRMSGTGTLFLNDANNGYSGGTIIDSGMVSVPTMGATGSGAITFNGGTLQITGGTNSSTRAFNLNSTGTIDITTGTFTFSGAFSGNGGLTKTGAGIMTLSGASNNYVGATTVNQGTLRITGGDDRLPTGTNLILNSGATFDLNAFNQTVAQLNDGVGGGGTVANVAGGLNTTSTLTVTGAGSFSGAITDGSGTRQTALTKSVGNTLTLTGNNTFTGATLVTGGTLSVDHNGTSTFGRLSGTTSVTVNGGGTLLLTNGGTTDRINNAAGVNLAGGTLRLNNAQEGTTAAAGVGALTLSGNTNSIIDLAGTSLLHLAASNSISWTGNTLSIYNWTGTTATGGGLEQILFGTDTTALTQTQLNLISFYSDGGSAFLGTAQWASIGNGEIVPIPEPGTWLVAVLSVGVLASTQRRRLNALFRRG